MLFLFDMETKLLCFDKLCSNILQQEFPTQIFRQIHQLKNQVSKTNMAGIVKTTVVFTVDLQKHLNISNKSLKIWQCYKFWNTNKLKFISKLNYEKLKKFEDCLLALCFGIFLSVCYLKLMNKCLLFHQLPKLGPSHYGTNTLKRFKGRVFCNI